MVVFEESEAKIGDEQDWRLQIPHDNLMGKTVRFQMFVPVSERWDHEHCIFCWEKFSAFENDLHAGYRIVDGEEDWICPEYFQDFQKRFRWRIKEE